MTGRQGNIIADDTKCGDCGAQAIHEQSEDETACADYFVYCTNAECQNYPGVHCGDLECPDWAHGMKTPVPDTGPPPLVREAEVS